MADNVTSPVFHIEKNKTDHTVFSVLWNVYIVARNQFLLPTVGAFIHAGICLLLLCLLYCGTEWLDKNTLM